MKKRVLFVCLGNICRSPLAHGILESMVREAGLSHLIEVDSAGTASYHLGELADLRSRKVAEKHGIRLTHRARVFAPRDLHAFDYILAMDCQNQKDILKHVDGDCLATIQLMRSYDPVNQNEDVPDPYYGDQSAFEEVFEMLQRSCAALLEEIKLELHR